MRLERVTERVILNVYKFQFHKGAIRTVPVVGRHGITLVFQFHKGAIRTYRNEKWQPFEPISIP